MLQQQFFVEYPTFILYYHWQYTAWYRSTLQKQKTHECIHCIILRPTDEKVCFSRMIIKLVNGTLVSILKHMSWTKYHKMNRLWTFTGRRQDLWGHLQGPIGLYLILPLYIQAEDLHNFVVNLPQFLMLQGTFNEADILYM